MSVLCLSCHCYEHVCLGGRKHISLGSSNYVKNLNKKHMCLGGYQPIRLNDYKQVCLDSVKANDPNTSEANVDK